MFIELVFWKRGLGRMCAAVTARRARHQRH
jgi:hypothetical protein